MTTAPGPDELALLVAIAIGVFGALIYEHFAGMMPVAPGGDTGTWLLDSFPYAGFHANSQEPFLSYPPASMPFLGAAVLIAGTPSGGAELFLGGVIIALGVAFYELALSMVVLRSVALFAEAALILEPDFQQIYYFGGYPNLFGLIFFFLALAFAIRFLRSRRPWHLAAFWATATVAVLSHALVGVILVGILLLVFLALLVYQRLPRELFSGVGIVGLLVFLGAALGYYEVVPRLGFHPPNYLTGSALTAVKSAPDLPGVLRPFYLESLASGIRGSGFPLNTTVTVEILWGASIAVIAIILVLRWVAPRVTTHRVLFLCAWLVATFGLSLGTYYLGVFTDYRRFAYMLYPLVILGGVVVGDAALTYTIRSIRLRGEPLPPTNIRQTHPLPAWRWRKWDRRQLLQIVVIVGVAGLLVFSAERFTIPGAQGYENFFAGEGHDQNFVLSMNGVRSSGLPGTIYSASESVDRWPSTLTDRAVYEARAPTGYTYTPGNLAQAEQCNLLLANQYSVTNGLVAAGVPGVVSGYLNASPLVYLYSYGSLRQVYTVPPSGIQVELNASPRPVTESAYTGALPTVLLPSNSSDSSMQLVYNGTGFLLTETINAVPGTDELALTFSAQATGSEGILAVSAKLSDAAGSYSPITPNATGPGTFSWFTNTTSGNYTTVGTGAPGTVLTRAIPFANATTGRGGSVVLSNSSVGGLPSPAVSLSFVTSTPGATNTIRHFGGLIDGPALFAQWDIRFILLENVSYSTGPQLYAFFHAVYGAAEFSNIGEWLILVVPL